MSRMLYRAFARACNNTVGNNRALDPNACYWAVSSTRMYCANRPNKPYKKKFYDKAHRTDRHTSGSLQNRDDLTKKQLPVSLEKRNEQDRQKESIPLEERIPKDTELYKIYNELRDLEKEMERLDNEFDSLFTVESFKKLAEKGSESEYVSNSSTSSEERESDSEYTNSEKSDSGSDDTDSDDRDLDDNVSSEESDSGSDDTNSDDTDSYDDMNSEESDLGSDDTNSDDMDSDDDMSSEESDSGSEESFSRQNRRFYKDRRR